MLDGIRDKKVIQIKNFFTKDELSILQPYCLDKTLTPQPENLKDPQSITSAYFYNDQVLNIMLHNKLSKAEEISKVKLFPTYAFWRGYTFGSILKDHKDRPSCEISITACIDSCGTKWPIHMEHNYMDIEVGDAVMYLGCDLLHGRTDHFKGKYMAQVFFHYVDRDGPFREHRNDIIYKSGLAI